MKEKRGVLILAFAILILNAIFIHAESIDTKNVLLKFSLNKGESITKNITISSNTGGVVDLIIEGIGNGVTLKENSLIFDVGEEKNIEVFFNSTSVEEGAYVGNIKIYDKESEKRIPIIFEIESKDVFFDGNLEIPAKFSNIHPGEQMTVQLDVFDLLSGGGTSGGLGSSSVDVEYSVHDLYGNKLISEKENFVIDKKATISKTITFPEDINEGQYVFSAVINYKSSIGVATDLFTVSKKAQESRSFSLSSNFSDTGIILVFFGFLFLVLILFFVYIIHDRDRMVLELRRYNTKELDMGKTLMREQEKVIRKQGKGGRKIRSEIKSKINRIKKRQAKRIEELKKLQKKGKISEMKRRLKEWKKQGYNTTFMEYKLKGLSQSQMKKILDKWKKEYKR